MSGTGIVASARVVLALLAILVAAPSAARDGIHTFTGTPKQERMDLYGEAMALAGLCKTLKINNQVLRQDARRYGINLFSGSDDMAFIKDRQRSYRRSLSRWRGLQCVIGQVYYVDDNAFIKGLLVEK